MKSLMQDYPLTLGMIFRRAERLWPAKRLVTATPGGGLRRSTYGSWAERSRRLGGVLDMLDVSEDGRVGTFAWNSARHLELYFAVPCSGRVLHTLNIRLFPEQLVYVVNHAQDEILFVDRSLLGKFWPLMGELPTVRHVVVMDDGSGDVPDDPRILDYETLLRQAPPAMLDAVTDEDSVASMCYTSGTTGNPKAVVYSHRSIVLHSMAVMMADVFGVSESDVILPVVPMFHVNAWGLCHAGVLAGSDLVFPGADLSPAAVAELIVEERPTFVAGVPTIWMGVKPLLEGRDVSSLRAVLSGGAAVPRALSEAYRESFGLPILQAWGMTETSPVATLARVRREYTGLPEDEHARLRATQGLPVPGVELRIADPDTGQELPWDGKASGEAQVAGPWIARSYYDDPREGDSFTPDGWLRTGDIAIMSPDGYLRIVDRTKDVIKSGGEWISSVELENEIMAHPKVAEAAVIAVAHDKWGERPLACVVVSPGEALGEAEILDWLAPRVAKWWLPDRVVFVTEVPKTSVGKFSKKTLRERYGDLTNG